jgi:aquaglyceroporin related protein
MSTTQKGTCSAQSRESGCTSLYLGSKEEESIVGLAAETDNTAPPPPWVWYKVRAYGRDAFSEFFGTLILILFGNGAVTQVLLSHDEKGNYQSISWGWG